MLAVAVLWTGASYLTKQWLYGEQKFKQPLFITYTANGLFTLLIPLSIALERWRGEARPWRARGGHGATQAISLGACTVACAKPASGTRWSRAVPARHQLRPHTYIAWAAVFISPLWMAAQFTYNASLGDTSVAASTTISNMASVFTLGLSILVLRTVATARAGAGIALCVAGGVAVAVDAARGDASGSDGNTLGGDVVAVLSAVLYGAYTVSIRAWMPDDGSISPQLLFGYIGAWNLVLVCPVVAWTASEWAPQLTWGIFGSIIVKGLVDNVLSDVLWAWAIVLLSPTAATVGLALTIPMSLCSDAIFFQQAPGLWLVVGAVLVSAGFYAVVTDEQAAAPSVPDTPAATATSADIASPIMQAAGAEASAPAIAQPAHEGEQLPLLPR